MFVPGKSHLRPPRLAQNQTLTSAAQILKPAEKKQKYVYGGMNTGRPVTPPRKPKSSKK